MHRRFFLAGAAAAATAPAAFAAAPDSLAATARDAWLYVLPLIEVAAARARVFAAAKPDTPISINRFAHAATLATAADRAITTPNHDTLYSSAFIDLTRGPVTLTIPPPAGRYQSVAIMDMYSNNDTVLSPRTPGGAAGVWRLVAPGQNAATPRDIVVATPHAWLLGRTLVKSDADIDVARAAQHALTLSGPEAPPPPPYAQRTSPWPDYFRSAAELLASDPPHFLAGQSAFERLRAAGQGAPFDPAGYSPAAQASIAAGVAEAQALVRGAKHLQKFIDGWSYPRHDLGAFGDNFVYRAIVAIGGLAALPTSQAMYMNAEGDGNGIFRGNGPYRLTLTAPIPADAFWSLTMYEATPDGQFFLTPNPINRYTIGDRTSGLVTGPGGSLDIWISRRDPGGARRANWLPAPAAGPFACTLRAYLPRPALLDGTYRLPRVTPV